ncbi:YkvA family protein [Paucibacter sp. M5-1]|uniref:YkvA family protein n=1 Tax=Paucibacter sp. M5-1 TaxID=3015998 RepID=UPI0022B90A45|nr:YkvA family protein [Paucibacter sp. M5-1]MCZ7881814.1 YkvA family protein [Paucibacter sp. M5-1]
MARRRGLLKRWAWALKSQVLAVYFAARDPAAPGGLRLLALVVAAYALSPIDLIPDFIPLLGYLDDLLIVPLGLWLVVRYMPEPVMARARLRAEALLKKPRSWAAAAVVIALWLLLAGLLTLWLVRTFPA